ncbi:hypothetical protein LPJ66_001554 [Kickxella alabastrina]|uniref:Uncharacterized protein n=1 Tax=Kickxella alabastrina TaxID=61397 RepID=A0ACC1ISW6_9FUNG|nr:hypothetical protein LPJ66_001554 [Kickxella alabastrina]
MLYINQLPLVIITNILRFAADSHTQGNNSWKDQLHLLAVCSTWRRLASRMLYRHIYLENTANHSDHTGKPIWKTNINLAAMTNNTPKVKAVQIKLSEFEMTVDALNALQSLFGFGRLNWNRVDFLDLKVYLVNGAVSEDERQIPLDNLPQLELESEMELELKNGLARFAQTMAQCMPHVTRFNLGAYTTDSMAKIIGNTLVNEYAGQLKSIKSISNLEFQNTRTFGHLEYLITTLGFDCKSLLPKVNPETLQYLELSNVTQSFSWDAFLGDSCGSSNTIVFKNLVYLKINFSVMPFLDMMSDAMSDRSRHGTGNNYRVHFPKLQVLKIHGDPAQTDFVATDMYPDYLEELQVYGVPGNLAMWKDASIKSMSSLHMSVFSASKEEEDAFYQSTNHFFSDGDIVECAEMSLFALDFPLDLDRVCWTNISTLSTMFSVDYSTVRALVSKLPQLEQLNTFMLKPGDLPAEYRGVTAPEQALGLGLAPLVSQLAHLCIYNNTYVTRGACLDVAALQLLVLQTQLLESLVIHNPELHDIMVDFIETFKAHFKHLDCIEVILGNFYM